LIFFFWTQNVFTILLQYEDEDFGEEFKINSFLAMVKGSEMVGIPYCGTG
jgi:hypothetical protein